MLVQGYHFPFPSGAYVEKSGNGFRAGADAVEPDDLVKNNFRNRKRAACDGGPLFTHRTVRRQPAKIAACRALE